MPAATPPTAATGDGPVLGVAIEHGRLVAGLVDATGEVVVRDRVTAPTREVWRALEQLVVRVVAAVPDGAAPAVAVGVSCAGPVDLQAGTVGPIGWRSWVNFPLAARLGELLGLPVHLASTATAVAESLQRWGDARGQSDFAVVLLDASVESACVIGGTHLFGAHGNAGSLSHVVVDPGGRTCWCGASGCATAYLAAPLLEAELNRPLRRAGPAIVERSGIMLGRAIASLLAMVDLDTVFVTGHVVDQLGDEMIAVARRELSLRSRLPHLGSIHLVEVETEIPAIAAAAALALGAVVEPILAPPGDDLDGPADAVGRVTPR